MLAVAGGIILATVILALLPLVIETIIEFPSVVREEAHALWHSPTLRWGLKWLLIGYVALGLLLWLGTLLGVVPIE